MSLFDAHEPTIPTQVLDGAVKEYPRERLYVFTALFLALLTGIEIATYAVPRFAVWNWGDKAGVITLLMLLMALKFFTVAYIFMHLRFDKPLLTKVFYAGIAVAVVVYVAVLTVFRLWWPAAHYSGPYPK